VTEGIVALDALDAQIDQVRRLYPNARLEASDGNRVLVIPDFPLPAGWNRRAVTLRILVPGGFPHVKPDCFFTDGELRLASGAEPGSSTLQAVLGSQYRWFSWHLATWDAVSGSLVQYVRFCHQRLREVR